MSFPAKYNGRCLGCDEGISIGEDVSRVDTDQGRVTVHTTHVEDGEMHVEIRESRTTPADTMPRGKTVRDRCDRCFMVPASNGICGCE